MTKNLYKRIKGIKKVSFYKSISEQIEDCLELEREMTCRFREGNSPNALINLWPTDKRHYYRRLD